jgi:integrase
MSINHTTTPSSPSVPDPHLSRREAIGWQSLSTPADEIGWARKPRRQSFDNTEIAAIFASPSYEQWATSPLLWWAPMLGLCMGIRAPEVCRLSPDDVLEVDGVTCILVGEMEFQDAEEHTTRASRRRALSRKWVLAVPQELLDAGFQDYVALARARGCKQLFPSGQKAPARDPSKWLSERFSRYLRARGIERGTLPRLRQTFVEAVAWSEIEWKHQDDLLRLPLNRRFPMKKFYQPRHQMRRLKNAHDDVGPIAGSLPAYRATPSIASTPSIT